LPITISAVANGRSSTRSTSSVAHQLRTFEPSSPAAPSYSAVRSLLRILEEKGHIRHEQDGPRYVYVPVVARDNAKRSAMRHLLQTFFDGSTSQAMSALLDVSSSRLDEAELDRLKKLIDQARKQGV
jgi:predicted transcriptional regulator